MSDTYAGMTQEQWDAANDLVAEGDRQAAARPIGPCPSWCIGPNSPEHQRWSANFGGDDVYEFTITHTSGGDFAEIETYVSVTGDDVAVDGPDIGMTFNIDDRFDAATARRFAAALLNAADRLEEIQRQS